MIRHIKHITAKVWIGPSMVALLLFMSCNNSAKTTEDELTVPEVTSVAIIPIERTQIAANIEVTGLFSTDNETLLSFKNGGIIENIYVKEGDHIKKGQLLAKLNLSEINAKAVQVKLAMEKAERDFERAQTLYRDSVVTLEQMQNARTGLEVVQQDWNTIQFNLRHSEIRAAENGFVLMKLANEGQVVGPGTPVLRVNGTSENSWLVKVGVSDRQWTAIQIGDQALISADTFNEEIPAKVVRKSEGLDPISGTFSVYVQPISTEGLSIASGMFAKVKIMGKTTEAWQIPYAALLDGDGGRGFVFVTDDGQTAKKIQVVIGRIEKERVTILSGLENHKSLVVAGSPYLKDGGAISVVKN